MVKFPGSGAFPAPCLGSVMTIGTRRFATVNDLPRQSTKRRPRQLLSTPDDELSQMNGLFLVFRP